MSWFKQASKHENDFWHHVNQIVQQKDLTIDSAVKQLSVWGYDENAIRKMLIEKGMREPNSPSNDVMDANNSVSVSP